MSINKLSKYGIVLVAAITVATVAQSQFGQSSTKVYADEIASTAPKTSEVPSITSATSENVSTIPTTSEAPAVVLASENSEAPETSALSSEDGGLAVTPTDIVSSTSTTSSENSRDKDETEEDKSFYFRYVEHTDSGDKETGTGVFSSNEDGRFVLPEGDDYRYSYYTITSDDGKSFKAGDVIPYDSPLLKHPNFDDNAITYTYYKNQPSVDKNIIVNPINRPSWHHGDSISYHVRYGVFERNSKYGVPAVIDIAPYDTVIVPLDKDVTVSAKTIPGYTLDSARKYETGSDIPDSTLTLSSSHFVTDNTGTPMAMFLYKKNNSETAFKDSLTPSAKPSSQSEGTLTYTVIYHFTGRDSSTVEYTIEPGETSYLKLGGKGAVAYPVISGTPSFYEVSYDRVKAGKTLYEFWQYDYHTHNADGTPKVTDTSSTPETSTTPATSEAPAVSTTPATSEAPAVSTTPATSEAPAVSTTPATSEAPAVSTTPATSLVPSKDNHSMNFVTPSYTQTRSAGVKSETDGKLTSQDLPKTGDTNSKVGMLGMIFVGLGLTSFVYKGRHRRS